MYVQNYYRNPMEVIKLRATRPNRHWNHNFCTTQNQQKTQIITQFDLEITFTTHDAVTYTPIKNPPVPPDRHSVHEGLRSAYRPHTYSVRLEKDISRRPMRTQRPLCIRSRMCIGWFLTSHHVHYGMKRIRKERLSHCVWRLQSTGSLVGRCQCPVRPNQPRT